MTPAPKTPAPDDELRPHSFDGIQEYDKRLPNWWLLTFYGAIVFWVAYWFYYHRAHIGAPATVTLQHELDRIEAAKMAGNQQLDDATLWKMSRNAVFVDAGRQTFLTTCASCHKEDLRGTDAGGIGPNLVDNTWIHGGKPTEIFHTVDKGVLEKGMPSWGPVIGARKVSEVVAFILSHHEEPK